MVVVAPGGWPLTRKCEIAGSFAGRAARVNKVALSTLIWTV